MATLILGLATACTMGCQPTVRIERHDVSVRPFFKASCDSLCAATCLACVDTLAVFATDADGRQLTAPRCHDMTGRWETLCDLTVGASLRLVEDLPIDVPVVIELQAYRRPAEVVLTEDAGVCQAPTSAAAGDSTACAARSSNDLMLWGRSRPTDLRSATGASRIEVEFECRAGCDCLAVGRSTRCPLALRPSACLAGVRCDRDCKQDSDCFEGALRCDIDAGRCATDVAGAARPFCASCATASDCADGLCVAPPRSDGGFCARSCPNHACPRAAKCAPVDPLSGCQLLP